LMSSQTWQWHQVDVRRPGDEQAGVDDFA
jgi:hypothetical protein